MITNIDRFITKIQGEGDVSRLRDREYIKAANDLSILMDKIKEEYEDGQALVMEIDSVTGTYAAVLSTHEYTRGVKDCLRTIMGLLGSEGI